MKKLYKDILLGLFTSIIIVGIIYGSNVYFSLQESKQRQERHKQEEERREKIKKYREILEEYDEEFVDRTTGDPELYD